MDNIEKIYKIFVEVVAWAALILIFLFFIIGGSFYIETKGVL